MKNISELNQKKLCDFYSMGEFVSTISRTIQVMSWGAHAWTKMSDKLLRFKVNAYRHSGHIYVCVNFLDLFDVYLTTTHGNVVKKFENVYLEDFIETVDNEIEKQPGYTF